VFILSLCLNRAKKPASFNRKIKQMAKRKHPLKTDVQRRKMEKIINSDKLNRKLK